MKKFALQFFCYSVLTGVIFSLCYIQSTATKRDIYFMMTPAIWLLAVFGVRKKK